MITDDERRSRLAVRQLLTDASTTTSIVAAAEAMCGLHASDPSSVYLAARARVGGLTPEDLESALYETRSVARVLGMRRTMFVVPTPLVPLLQFGCVEALAPRERKRLVGWIEQADIAADGDRWLGGVERATLAALEERGGATAAELSEDVPELKEKISFGEGKSWAGQVGLSTRVLFLLATQGRILRGRPLGSWTSSQYRWVPMTWLFPDGLVSIPVATARKELARRWLASFGPGTADDLKWWTGWTKTQVAATVDDIDVVEVETTAGPAIVLADDAEVVPPPAPWVALLPSLDPTVMGWRHRDWYLGDHAPSLFDRNGNAGPTIWCNGRVVGGWAQRDDGDVVHELLEDIGSEAAGAVASAAAELQTWLGSTRIKPRFRTPLERTLVG